MPNPLAIGVTLCGLLLDAVVPRPKPGAGIPRESALGSPRPVLRTPRREASIRPGELVPRAR